MATLVERDLKALWHPCAQMKDYESFPPLPIVGAKGVYVQLEDGRKLIDAYASWWCKNLGHGHPRLLKALENQLKRFEHVALPHVTHERIVELCERLKSLTGMHKAMFASDGSCAVEMALKLSLNAQQLLGRPQRNRVMCLENAYHGETLWAMAVSDLGIYKAPYVDVMPQATVIKDIPYVESDQVPLWHDASEVWANMQPQLAPYAETTASLIIEPVVQGAAGMRVISADFLQRLCLWAQFEGIHVIVDEIMTGLGRVGAPLASHLASITPDFVCLGKGLTAGVLPMSVALMHDDVYELFYDDYAAGKNFLHSHTHTGNALAVAVACECLQVLEEESIFERAQTLQQTLRHHFERIAQRTGLLGAVRGIGGVVAADLNAPLEQRKGFKIYQAAATQGALLRPLGNTLYWCPPLTINDQEVERLAIITQEAILAAH